MSGSIQKVMGDGCYLVQTLGLEFGWTNTWTSGTIVNLQILCQFVNFVMKVGELHFWMEIIQERNWKINLKV